MSELAVIERPLIAVVTNGTSVSEAARELAWELTERIGSVSALEVRPPITPDDQLVWEKLSGLVIPPGTQGADQLSDHARKRAVEAAQQGRPAFWWGEEPRNNWERRRLRETLGVIILGRSLGMLVRELQAEKTRGEG